MGDLFLGMVEEKGEVGGSGGGENKELVAGVHFNNIILEFKGKISIKIVLHKQFKKIVRLKTS